MVYLHVFQLHLTGEFRVLDQEECDVFGRHKVVYAVPTYAYAATPTLYILPYDLFIIADLSPSIVTIAVQLTLHVIDRGIQYMF
jgi:hypothetical protein